MAMTREERATQIDLANRLGEQGYATYAKLFMLFDLRLTSDPRYIGFMEPGKARITLNRTLEPHQMLLTIRHEILHEYLTHEMRLLDHIAEKNPDLDADEVSLKEILYKDDVFNIAADYEISNRGYTEQDKNDIRHIKFNGQIVSGLVTEDKHPDWINMTVEEMYDLLRDERDQAQQDAQQNQQDSQEQQDSQSNDEGEGASGESQSGEGQEGEQDGDQDSDEQEGESGDGQEGESGESGEGQEGESEEQSSQSGEGADGRESEQSSQSQSNSSSQQSGQRTPDGSSSNRGGNGQSEPLQVIRGTFKDGKFYGLDGKEIVPGA